MKNETQIKIGRITALVLFVCPIVGLLGILIISLLSLSTRPLSFFQSSYGILCAILTLPTLIILYCFISALRETKFVKGLVFFLLYCGLVICTSIYFTGGIWSWFLQIPIFLLLLQGVIGLYKVQEANLKKPKDDQNNKDGNR